MGAISSPDPANLATSIPIGAFGDLLTFSFRDAISASNAFSLFQVDNTLYTNTIGTNFYGFALTNAGSFTTVYSASPPHGTPIPWLISYGFTNNFAAAELLDPNGNGFEVWQDYLAGLNPRDRTSTFDVQVDWSANAPEIIFNTALNRTYRIEWAESLSDTWTVLRDGIAGTGGEFIFADLRDLSTVGTMYYRVVVDTP